MAEFKDPILAEWAKDIDPRVSAYIDGESSAITVLLLLDGHALPHIFGAAMQLQALIEKRLKGAAKARMAIAAINRDAGRMRAIDPRGAERVLQTANEILEALDNALPGKVTGG